MLLLVALIAIVVLLNSRGAVERIAARLRAWREETHSRHFELFRHFFSRFFDSDLIADASQARVVAGAAIGIVASVSLIFGQAYYHKYAMLVALDSPEPYHRAERGDVLFLVTLNMVAAALFTTIEWPALFPSLRDYLALASLPVRMREIFTAKFLALLAVAMTAITAAALPPSLIIPATMTGRYSAGCVWHVPGIFFASLLGGWFVFLVLVAFQGVLLNVLPIRLFPRVSLALQGVLLALFLAGLPFVFSIPTVYNRFDPLPAWSIYVPPCWFFAIDQIIFGAHDPLTLHLARASLLALLVSAAAAVLAYLWSYRRHRVRVLEAPSAETAATGRAWPALADRLLPDARTLGVFAFIQKNLARSRQHRLILIAFGALAVALISEGFSSVMPGHAPVAAESLRRSAIAIPLALSLFLIAGLRYLFRLPIELRANWLFRITEPGHSAALAAGVDRFLLYCGAVPVTLITLPMEMSLPGFRTGLGASIICFLLSLVPIEVLLFTFEKIPFTSSYLPGRRPLIETFIAGATIALGYVWGFATLLSTFLKSFLAAMTLAVVLLTLWWKIRRARLDSRKMLRFEFEESLQPAVQLLGIERD